MKKLTNKALRTFRSVVHIDTYDELTKSIRFYGLNLNLKDFKV